MFYWKNESSTSKGVVVETTPSISKAKKRFDYIDIPSRNGNLVVDRGTYDTFNVKVECHFDEDKANRDEVVSWLDGYGKLSFDNEREYDAVIINAVKLEKIAYSFKKFLIQFECQPIAKSKVETEETIISNPQTVTITEATAKMYPTIEITGSGDLTVTINNETFNIKGADGTFILDCELKEITKDGNNASHYMKYDFPTLNNGSNEISYTGTITNFKISYKKAYL